MFGGPIFLLFILLHYALIGAAVGGVIGMAKDRQIRMAASMESVTEY